MEQDISETFVVEFALSTFKYSLWMKHFKAKKGKDYWSEVLLKKQFEINEKYPYREYSSIMDRSYVIHRREEAMVFYFHEHAKELQIGEPEDYIEKVEAKRTYLNKLLSERRELIRKLRENELQLRESSWIKK